MLEKYDIRRHNDRSKSDELQTQVTVADHSLQAGVFTQDVYEFADSINRTIIGGYHQTVGFSGGYFLVRCSLPTWSPTIVHAHTHTGWWSQYPHPGVRTCR